MGPIERIEQAFINFVPSVRVMQENLIAQSADVREQESTLSMDNGDAPYGEGGEGHADGATVAEDMMGSMDPDQRRGRQRFVYPGDDEVDIEVGNDEDDSPRFQTQAAFLGLAPHLGRRLAALAEASLPAAEVDPLGQSDGEDSGQPAAHEDVEQPEAQVEDSEHLTAEVGPGEESAPFEAETDLGEPSEHSTDQVADGQATEFPTAEDDCNDGSQPTAEIDYNDAPEPAVEVDFNDEASQPTPNVDINDEPGSMAELPGHGGAEQRALDGLETPGSPATGEGDVLAATAGAEPQTQPEVKRRRLPRPTISTDDRTPLSPAVAEVLNSLVWVPHGGYDAERIRRVLARFGPRILSQCKQFGIRVLCTQDPASQVVPTLMRTNDRHYDGAPSAYFATDRLCFLQADYLDEDGDEFGDRIVVTFASALDHAIGEEDFASRRSPAVQASYQACLKNETGHTFIDGFCALSPLHYFAQGVAAWMSQTGSSLKADAETAEVYCSRSRLYDLDRSLYCYLQYLLRDTCRDD